MHESFGTRLRRQRERQQISLTAIAKQTKISRPLLEALERDEGSRWPGGIFRRAYVRAYAEAIGLNADDTVREFLGLYPDPIDTVPIGAALSTVASSKQHPPTRLAQLADAATEWALGFLRRLVHPPAEQEAPAASQPPAPAVRETFDLAAAARALGAVGIVVWVWDHDINALTPKMAHGYSDRMLAQLPNVAREADNATAAALRSGRTCAVAAPAGGTGALVAPILSESGCIGVFAVELPHGAEKSASTREAVSKMAMTFGRFVEPARPAARPGARGRTRIA
jgi:transcriptional regulator with XRE-family HTH domain